MLLSQAVEGFVLDRAAGGYSPNTLQLYRLFLGKLIKFTEDAQLEAIDTDTLRHWLVSLAGMAQTSRRNAWSVMRAFFGWSHQELGTARPDLTISMPRVADPEVIPFTQDEIKNILHAVERTAASDGTRRGFTMRRITAKRDKSIVLILLDTGLRVSELARLRIKDVNMEAAEIQVVPYMSGRKSRRRTVYMGRVALKSLWSYLTTRENPPQDAPLLVTSTNKPMTRDEILKLLTRIGKRIGCHVHPHKFRHTFAIQYLRGGGDVFTLQRLLGHADLKMVRYYLSLADTDDKNAHRKASPADRWNL